MQIDILAFGITKDILGNTLVNIEIPEGSSVQQLKEKLIATYPKMQELT